jgi:hypothetical protein
VRAHGIRAFCDLAGIRYAPESLTFAPSAGDSRPPLPTDPTRRARVLAVRARAERRAAQHATPPRQVRGAAEAWLVRCDALALAGLRRRWRHDDGDGARDLAALEGAAKEREARRAAARELGSALRQAAQRALDRAWLDAHPGAQPRQGLSVPERASRYLARLPPSISGSGGHGALWQAVLAAHVGFDLPAPEAARLIEAEYNPRCQPPWSRREIAAKIVSARRSTRPRGYLLHAGR